MGPITLRRVKSCWKKFWKDDLTGEAAKTLAASFL
jgi:hypothetical protein